MSIDQLADLRIAIIKTQATLDENTKNNTILSQTNEHLSANNLELDKELKIQEARIKEAIAENEKLRKEKEWILSKFAQDNEKAYATLRETETKVANETQQNALRMIEIDKREHSLVNKENTNKSILNEAKILKKEAREEMKSAENAKLSLQRQEKSLRDANKRLIENETRIKDIEKNIELRKIELNDKESEVLQSIQKQANQVAELNTLTLNSQVEIEKLNRVNAIYKEYKEYFAKQLDKGSDVTIEDLENIVNRYDKKEDGLPVVKDEVIVDEWLSNEEIKKLPFNELRQLAKISNIVIWKNPTKKELIKLLTK